MSFTSNNRFSSSILMKSASPAVQGLTEEHPAPCCRETVTGTRSGDASSLVWWLQDLFGLARKRAATHLVGGLLQHGIAAAVGGVELHFGRVVLVEPGGNQAPAHVHEDPLGGVGILSNDTEKHLRSEPRRRDHEHAHSSRGASLSPGEAASPPAREEQAGVSAKS